MRIIDKIYKGITENQTLDSELILDSEIQEILKREGLESQERISNLLCEAGGCGHEQGFQSGFQTAVALFVECLSEKA